MTERQMKLITITLSYHPVLIIIDGQALKQVIVVIRHIMDRNTPDGGFEICHTIVYFVTKNPNRNWHKIHKWGKTY